jgi:hypothetical protein
MRTRNQMKANSNPRRSGGSRRMASFRLRWVRTLACCCVLAALAGSAQPGQQAPPGNTPNPDKSIHDPVLTALPDPNTQMEMRDQQAKQQNYTAANAERRKQIADDSARLLKLATDLKAEVDKTSKDTLSLGVIRKADEIERLAHSVKEKMKLSVGAS